MPWDPAQYARFAGHRLRPAGELLARVAASAPETVVDLGCGTGSVTRLLAARWPDAWVTGVDNSPEMLAEVARQSTGPGSGATGTITWEQADIAGWRAETPVDVLFSNAALHWLPDHRHLFAGLLDSVADGGWLAVQMPRNWDAPSHAAVEDIARLPEWTGRFDAVARPTSLPPADYYALLAESCRSVDVWETTYLHALQGENAVAEWTRGTFLLSFLDALSEPLRSRFEDEYRRRMAIAYPRRHDGITLYPFRRLFAVAQR